MPTEENASVLHLGTINSFSGIPGTVMVTDSFMHKKKNRPNHILQAPNITIIWYTLRRSVKISDRQ
jgi:hypothetical protein